MDLGKGVSYVNDERGYNYDMVVFQKGKPPLDSELNLVQQIQNLILQQGMSSLPSGWLSYFPIHTDTSLTNSFYTQDPTNARPEYALVNGHVIHVTNTDTAITNTNYLDLGIAPAAGNLINGIFLEVWRALIAPNDVTNKPPVETIIDSLNGIHMVSSDIGWVCGDNGLILNTQNGGQSWAVQFVNTKSKFNGVFFAQQTIGWVVGNNGAIARTSSAGSSWTVLSSGITENLYSVYAVSQLIAWAVGDSGRILKTTNGINWVVLNSGITAALKKVYFYDNLIGWAVGENGTILKTTNGGTNWVQQTSGTTQTLNSIRFYDLNFGFAVGNNGTILRTSDGGATWVIQSGNVFVDPNYTTISQNLYDVTLVPNIDTYIVNEEVSAQLGPTGITFVTANKPITIGDGNGTITNNPADVKVTVNGVQALVDTVDGANGRVTLSTPPGPNTVVKVNYYYRAACAIFQGKAWIVGDVGTNGNGTILATTDIGQKWIPQASHIGYSLNGVSFINQSVGWAVGANSVIEGTTSGGETDNGGTGWIVLQSGVFVRQVQRIFPEGNIGVTSNFLVDDSIHPDANIETTKRVQVQYKIRMVSGVDPASSPEAGLSGNLFGEGPNASGSFPYENMGLVNGDYGCWRAQCLNTVDGYCYAVPMFFINRRNSSPYDPATNPNGSNQSTSSFIRPDLLTSEMIVDSDILDVRHKIVIPSVSFLMSRYFDLLSSNQSKTNFYRLSDGGDRYGIELLQVDRVGGVTTDGGSLISGVTLDTVVDGAVSSEATISTVSQILLAGATVPTQQNLTVTVTNALFHPDPARYKAVYNAPTLPALDKKPIPGYFVGFGTPTVTFIFDASTETQTTVGSYLVSYKFYADEIIPSSTSLTYVPSDPKLVRNYNASTSFYYHGVLDSMDYKVIESWDSDFSSGATKYTNRALVYVTKEGTDVNQQYRPSPVEIHFYKQVTATSPTYTVGSSIKVSPGDDITYDILTIKKINNVTTGFSHKINNISTTVSDITITAVPGYDFINNTIIEIVAMVVSASDNRKVRNGAAVNFTPELKKLSDFVRSDTKSIQTSILGSFSITASNPGDIILGCSTTETGTNLNQPVCFIRSSLYGDIIQMNSVTVSGFDTTALLVTDPGLISGTPITMQLLVKQGVLKYNQTTDGLMIGYNYIPPQCQVNIPTTLTLDILNQAYTMYVSNLGTGGGVTGEPYVTPLEHIPVNDPSISTDSIFNNMSPLQYANFKVDSGFVQAPVFIIGSASSSLTLSQPATDLMKRVFYSVCSREVKYISEGLQSVVGRKIYIPMLARVNDRTNSIYMHGEYVLVIFSRAELTSKENITGYFSGGNCSISIYRLPNRPLSRIP